MAHLTAECLSCHKKFKMWKQLKGHKCPIKCQCNHSIKHHLGYDKDTDLAWMLLNLGPCEMTECTCHQFKVRY